jgi:hypothetical protein
MNRGLLIVLRLGGLGLREYLVLKYFLVVL